MTSLDLSTRDVEDIIGGGFVRDRADLARVVELTAFMRASREVEPAPPMRPDLVRLIGVEPPPAN
ncbi:MAG TPA: hypothetical protein VFZ79_13015 [Acidimicrobiales bacterium]